jgi:hypothetical protein
MIRPTTAECAGITNVEERLVCIEQKIEAPLSGRVACAVWEERQKQKKNQSEQMAIGAP